MKKIKLFIACAGVLMLTASCHDEYLIGTGEGLLKLSTSVSTDMKVVSRSDENQLENSLVVWIANEKGVVRLYDKDNAVPDEAIGLLTGHYKALAWAGDSVSASWDSRWFRCYEEFDINRGETTQLDLVCKIANVGVSVQYVDGIENVLSDIELKVSLDKVKDGTLEYHGLEDGGKIGTEDTGKIGYFMMPSFSPDLAYTLTGTQVDGSALEYTGTIENAKSGYHYILKVTYVPDNTEVGGGHFSIEIDESAIEENTDIELIGAPKIQGYGFDISSPLGGERGEMTRKCVYISSGTVVSQVLLESEEFLSRIPIISGTRFEMLGMSEAAKEQVEAAGINYVVHDFDPETEGTLLQINFEKEFLNSLEYGERNVKITAIDRNGKISTATLALVISDDDVQPGEVVVDEVWATKATLYGTLLKDNVTNPGFKYRSVASRADEWTEVYDVKINGTTYTAEITGLTPATTYEYKTVSDGFESDKILTFTTENAVQLPNSSFEDWYYYNNKIWIPGKNYTDDYFWDSGNHGGSLVSKNFTTRSDKYKHTGDYSACLKSEKVVIQFAAGNIFAGKYLDTSGTNGILGWGRPFTTRPKSINVYVKYEPVNVTDGGSHIKKGDLDQGIIYMALVDNTKQSYNGQEWPCVIKTKSSELQLFDKNGANVIAYGEHVFTSATEGDDMILINIPLEYKKNIKPSNVIFVASASRYGDYFEGGSGSTLYIDDIELVY